MSITIIQHRISIGCFNHSKKHVNMTHGKSHVKEGTSKTSIKMRLIALLLTLILWNAEILRMDTGKII